LTSRFVGRDNPACSEGLHEDIRAEDRYVLGPETLSRAERKKVTAPHILVETSDRVLRLTLNRPEKHNALSRELLEDLRATFDAHSRDEALVAAVVRGAGARSFAAGGDLRDLASVRTLEAAREMAIRAKAALNAIRSFPVPVVAALNGDALGGGAELAVACDFRVAAPHARIGFVQGRLNITTAWGGGVDLLEIAGRAAGLRLLARSEVLEARAALSLRLYDAIAAEGQDLDGALEEFLAPIRQQTPRVLRAFKALATAARRGLPRQEMEELETASLAETWVHPDHWAAADKILGPRR
jgi:enoyl-CoA hydratase